MGDVQDSLIELLSSASLKPKLVRKNTIYLEDYTIVVHPKQISLYYHIEIYPHVAAATTILLYEFCRASKLKFSMGDVYYPIQDAFGEATDVVFGEDAMVAFEKASSSFYSNQKYITEFLKNTEEHQLHHC